MSLIRPLGQRTCAVDLAPLLYAPLFMPNGIRGRGMPLTPRTRSPDAVRAVPKGDMPAQRAFVQQIFGLAA